MPACPDPADPTRGAACDCAALRPPDALPAGLYLHSPAHHVRQLLKRAMRDQGIPHQDSPAGVFLPHPDADILAALLGAFTPTERAELLAAPATTPGGPPDAWQASPLERWAQQLGTPWFFPAAEQLRFHLQPIADLRSGRVYGYEALVRADWQGDLIGAGPLLQAAAAHGQARAFDALARRGAIRQAYPHLKPGEVLFINFAPGVIYNPDVCLQTTFQACREVGADFSRLLFEVTESEAFPDLNLLQRILERYRAEGAQVALDDLGAGHTSLSFLDMLRPDIVKLDRALISGVRDDDPRVLLIQALIRYAHDLGIRVVAEGVETESELRLLKELGADYAQGYFLGRPAPVPGGLSAQSAGLWNSA
ncbi:EAL domain-containing protein [Deinococcus enclensis]|uniref:EAL domain-containing protein (Putative c-di-GMP-specific phosphodiesterase class I) n=1 Tax=Deinococcus enclensis TaxID=1049582 RepID=A0ABT9MHL0_9DEIO|nr:EAL domain-containing protein [Deinococcus enclensis]MDP9766082.1 EAL domain-containing protein (putative c-di-GMP-specific phosphodiesterase class I) [Deinococcus enclensis]